MFDCANIGNNTKNTMTLQCAPDDVYDPAGRVEGLVHAGGAGHLPLQGGGGGGVGRGGAAQHARADGPPLE